MSSVNNMTLAAIILTHNSAFSIKTLLASLSWCDEIIVIDDQSHDYTRQLAKKLGALVFTRSLNHNFAAQRNFGLRQAKSDWVLFVDADEIVSLKLAKEIKAAITTNTYSALSLQRLDIFLNRTLYHGETGHTHFIRLARRQAGLWHRPVHEVWHIRGTVGNLSQPLYHQPHPTIHNFIGKINFYTDIEVAYRIRHSQAFNLFELLFYPPAKFMLNYFIKLGCLDGLPGLIMALMMSLHSLLVRIKMYEKTSVLPAHRPSFR